MLGLIHGKKPETRTAMNETSMETVSIGLCCSVVGEQFPYLYFTEKKIFRLVDCCARSSRFQIIVQCLGHHLFPAFLLFPKLFTTMFLVVCIEWQDKGNTCITTNDRRGSKSVGFILERKFGIDGGNARPTMACLGNEFRPRLRLHPLDLRPESSRPNR